MITNNGISADTDGVRVARTELLSGNIDTYAAELGIVGTKLAACQTAAVDWMGAITITGVEAGEAERATEEFNTALSAAYTYYTRAKGVLLSIIYDIDKNDQIIKEYGLNGAAPRDFNGLDNKINRWIETDARLNAEVPPDPRVAPASIVAGLATHLDTIRSLWHNSATEMQQKTEAYRAKQNLFDMHSSLLSFVLSVAKFTWGDDDSRLRLLGFCPSSEVWTQNKPHAPKNLAFDPDTGIFSWDVVEDVDSYELSARITGKKGKWTTFWGGTENSTTDKPSSPNIYDIRCRAITGDTSGNWCTPIEVDLGQ